MRVTRFEDLDIWKNARIFCTKIRETIESGMLQRNFSLRDQVLRSSGSCMDNIAEGFERDGNREFVQFLSYAKASLGESRSQVHRMFDSGYIDEDKYQELIKDCTTLSTQISNLMDYLAKSEYKGRKKHMWEQVRKNEIND